MKIVVIGAPGSGKTYLSQKISEKLNLKHIECDSIFWGGSDLRSEVAHLTESDNWIVDGHISKIFDIVVPRSDKFIVVEGSTILGLYRATRRDWRNFKKAWHNIQFYEKLAIKRNDIIQSIQRERSDDLLILDNFPDLSESDLAAFCERIKSSTVKLFEPAIKSKGSRKIKENKAKS
jgi:adenylate kinase family enzyme